MRNKELDSLLRHFTFKLKDEFPNILVEPTYDTWEGEDADIDIYAPEESKEKVQERASELCNEILLEHNYLVVSFVHPLDDHPRLRARL